MLLRRVSLCLPVLAALAMAAPLPTSAQEPVPPCTDREDGSTVLGTVSDQDSGEPVAEATRQVLPLGCGTLTDSDGRFRIEGLPAGGIRSGGGPRRAIPWSIWTATPSDT